MIENRNFILIEIFQDSFRFGIWLSADVDGKIHFSISFKSSVSCLSLKSNIWSQTLDFENTFKNKLKNKFYVIFYSVHAWSWIFGKMKLDSSFDGFFFQEQLYLILDRNFATGTFILNVFRDFFS